MEIVVLNILEFMNVKKDFPIMLKLGNDKQLFIHIIFKEGMKIL